MRSGDVQGARGVRSNRDGAPRRASSERPDEGGSGGSRGGRPGGRAGGPPGARQGASRYGASRPTRRDGDAPGRGRSGDSQRRVAPRRVERQLTAAERRAQEVRERRGPRAERPPAERPDSPAEIWVDEGSVRDEARRAANRARGGSARDEDNAAPRRVDEHVEPGKRRQRERHVAPEVREELIEAGAPGSLERYEQRLASAAEALDRERFADARRMVQPVLRELPDVAFAHEIAGLALYRMGRWRQAAQELEVARRLDGSVRHHAVLADCYRALRRYAKVDELWRELREASPDLELMAEGRIVAAGSLADRGDIAGALEVMSKAMADAERSGRKVRPFHLRQWYVVADLYDRLGNVVSARRWFRLVAQHDAEFADVDERLRTLGR
ncbi:MAG: hypothetical protein RJB61_2210 [Actinomycetota bacterium]